MMQSVPERPTVKSITAVVPSVIQARPQVGVIAASADASAVMVSKVAMPLAADPERAVASKVSVQPSVWSVMAVSAVAGWVPS